MRAATLPRQTSPGHAPGNGEHHALEPAAYTDDANGVELAKRFGSEFRFDHDRSRFRVYQKADGRWIEDSTGRVPRSPRRMPHSGGVRSTR